MSKAIDITLRPAARKFISRKVASGNYASPSAVVEEGLAMLAQRDKAKERQLKRLRKLVAAGLEQLDAGQGITAKTAFEELKRKTQAWRRRHA